MVAILAHEVGHHIRLHTVIPGRDHEFELEADYQAGFILRRMGATLEQTQAAFRTVGCGRRPRPAILRERSECRRRPLGGLMGHRRSCFRCRLLRRRNLHLPQHCPLTEFGS